jgi:hypothetical protein
MAWMAFTSMLRRNGFTFLAVAIMTLDMFLCTSSKDADHYKLIGKIPTRAGAGTSFWSPELNRFYVGAPAHDNEEAAILVFEPQP